MANSCIPGPLGLAQSGRWIWPRTPGSLGFNDQGDPNLCTRLGDTPGPLGLNDWGDPSLPQLDGRHGFVGGMLCRSMDGVPLALGTSNAAAAEIGTLTLEALKVIAPKADEIYLRKMADELNTGLATYGLDSRLRRAHFFAQVLEEAGPELEGQVENLNYAPEALKSKFSYYKGEERATEADTDGYERDAKTRRITRKAAQETIANKIYADRIGNGNQASGDGWKFRGRGFIQVTGRANYKSVTEQYKKLYTGTVMDFETMPEKLGEFPYNLRSAVCFWIRNNLHIKADAGSADADVDSITAVVNKHTDSYAKRRAHFTSAWTAFR